MGLKKPDPGQDPRGAPDLMPIWNILDTTDWFSELEYAEEVTFQM